jgi:hypothetical protein
MRECFRLKVEEGKPWRLMIFSPLLTALMLVGIFASFTTRGYAQPAGAAGTVRVAYDRCLTQYASMEDRIALGRPRPTDNLGKKYAECAALYNQLTSPAGSSQQAPASGQPENVRQAYDRCQGEYATMEDRIALGRPRATDNLKKKYVECEMLYNRLTSSSGSAQTQSTDTSGTTQNAYERCLQEYASMEDRIAFDRARPTDNLGKKHAECTALYNRLVSTQAQTGGRSGNPQDAYERCLQEYASMEDRIAFGRARPTDNLDKKHAECTDAYLYALVSRGRFPMRINGQESVSISQRTVSFTADVMCPAEVRNAYSDYYYDWWIGDQYAGRSKSSNAINLNVPRKVGKHIVKADAYLWTGKGYLGSASGERDLEVKGVDVTVSLTRAGSNDAVNGWASLGPAGAVGSAVHKFYNVAPGTHTLKGGATGYKEKSISLAVREENISTTLQLEPSASFTTVIFRVLDKKKQEYVQNAAVTIGRETKHGGAPSFSLVEAQMFTYRVTAPGYVDQSGSLHVGKAKEQAEQIIHVYLERIPQGRIGTGTGQ